MADFVTTSSGLLSATYPTSSVVVGSGTSAQVLTSGGQWVDATAGLQLPGCTTSNHALVWSAERGFGCGKEHGMDGGSFMVGLLAGVVLSFIVAVAICFFDDLRKKREALEARVTVLEAGGRREA